jgi:hypothetical protein
MASYYLARHVFFCRASRNWIFLDLKNDKYLSASREEADALGQNLYGWQDDASATTLQHSISLPTANLASELLARGMLRKDANNSKAAIATTLSPANTTIQDSTYRPITLSEAIWFFGHAVRASLTLRVKRLERTVETLVARKRRNGNSIVPFDLDRATEIVQIFNAIRPLYPRKYLCLYDSLALLNLMNSRDLYPLWVFGVCEDPFSAHCWLQHGQVVFNDNLERVNSYTPIMAI